MDPKPMTPDELVNRLTRDEAREALKVLVGMPDPVRRWTLEAIAIAAGFDKAKLARSMKRPIGG